MTLQAWLDSQDRKLAWLAEQLGLSVTSASRLVRGQQNIPLATAAQIEALTGGAVTVSELLDTFRAAQGAPAAEAASSEAAA